jgi:hypothetical protein
MELDYGGGVPTCWRSERSGGVVYELRRGDVVWVVHLSRTGNDWSGGSAVSQTAAEKKNTGECREGQTEAQSSRLKGRRASQG